VFKINVHREAVEKRQRAQKRQAKILIVRALYVVVLVLITGTFTFHLLLLRQNISAKEEELSKIQEMLIRYEPVDGAVSADKIFLVSKLKSGGPKWSTKLKVLSSLLPSRMWLTEISLAKATIDGKKRDILQVEGATYIREGHEGLGVILEFLKDLRENESFSRNFESIELLSSRRSRDLEKEELNFEFICLIP
jgi:hypothetical protein